MSWLIKQNKDKKKFRIWSTIVDAYFTPWLDREEVIKFILQEWEERFEKEKKELRENFPKGWTDKDDNRLIL